MVKSATQKNPTTPNSSPIRKKTKKTKGTKANKGDGFPKGSFKKLTTKKTKWTKKIIALGGIITLDDLSHLNQSLDTSVIIDNLKEDLFQAIFPQNKIIDIGWHPEFCQNGTFIVSLIKAYDWEHPIFSDKAKNWGELHEVISIALEKLET